MLMPWDLYFGQGLANFASGLVCANNYMHVKHWIEITHSRPKWPWMSNYVPRESNYNFYIFCCYTIVCLFWSGRPQVTHLSTKFYPHAMIAVSIGRCQTSACMPFPIVRLCTMIWGIRYCTSATRVVNKADITGTSTELSFILRKSPIILGYGIALGIIYRHWILKYATFIMESNLWCEVCICCMRVLSAHPHA